MSSIHEGKVLFIANLPSGLISRRQLQNHFSEFGTVDRISVDKHLGNCLISFSSNADAVNAKVKGKVWNSKYLNIYWDKNSSFDPRSSEEMEQQYESTGEVVDVLWSDDDKESFGIDEDKTSRAFKKKRQKTLNDLITSHLKPFKSQAERQLLRSSPKHTNKTELDIQHKEQRKTPITVSESDLGSKKPIFIRNVKQDIVKTSTPEASGLNFGESILKRKIEKSEHRKTSNIKKGDDISPHRLARRIGESVLKKKTTDPEVSILEEHGDHFIERKIVEAMETGSSSESEKKMRQPSKHQLPIKTIKKTGIRTRGTQKKSLEPIVTSNITHDSSMVLLKNKIATTLKEKYNLLDERDKVLRKLEVKDSNVKTAGAMKGTCPDMCPEKERIMRSFRRLVSIYEMGIDRSEMVSHLAVKEYSRSSADQDEPLSHELRPEPVLTMTMNYLITTIINRIENPEENIAEWYNFCWDRLRGIRKDIIQQQLCNLQIVEIIEQCARFHICCYDYLWGIDVSIFDDKINTENLMNCLQTLVHMYEDLSRRDICCPNEAEFNAYMIILKLNSGDLLWEYQSFSSKVRLSSFIKAAINLYNAFSSKICSRFFSIVKKSPYLMACLSHRYFSTIRTSALETIAKAYTPRGKVVHLPLEHMKSTLKFDSVEDTVTFCENHGIFLKENKQEFSIKKNSFYIPESTTHVKSFSSIIRNMRLSPAQAVVGENNKIPKYTPHEVHSSFDSEGKLKKGALDASDQALKIKKLFSNINIPLSSPSPPKSFEPVLPSTIPTVSLPKHDNTNPVIEEIKEKFTFKFVLPQIISSEVNANTFTNTKSSVSPKLITGDVFKTPDNSFVEQDVLQIPIEELPQDLYDPFYDTQGNQFNDIQAVEIDAERVEEMYQDVKNYYEHVKESDLQVNESSNKHVTTASAKENEFSLPATPKSIFSFTLNNKENICKTSGNSGHKICPKAKDKDKNFAHSQNLKFTPEIKTKFVIDSLEPKKENNFKMEDGKKKIETVITEQEKQEELRLQKVKKEIEKKKREMEARRRKEIEEAKVLRKLKKDLRERLKVVNARCYAKRWKEKVQRLKKMRQDFPMLIQLSVKDHLTLWGSIGNSKRLASVRIVQRLQQLNTITKVVKQVLQSGIPNSVSYSGDLLTEQIASAAAIKLYKRGNISPIFWKLIVSIPSGVNEDTSTLTKLIEIWCKRTFYKNEAELGSVQCTMTSLQIPVYTCVHLLKNINDSKLCDGMSSLMLITVNQWETAEQTVHRFMSLVTSQNSCFVSVLKIGGFIMEPKLKESLVACKNEGIISDWAFQEWSNPNCVSKSLSLIAQHIKVVPEMYAAPIDFLLMEMTERFFSALSADQCSSIGLKTAAHLPNNIIRLYNICIAKLEDLLVSSKLEKHSHFPKEFKPYVSELDIPGGIEQFSGSRYDGAYKIKISKMIQSLTLPEFTNWPPKSCNHLINMLKCYCIQVKDVTLFPQIIRLINISEEDELTECLSSISWITITELWAKQVINYQMKSYCKKPGKKTIVLYNKQDLTKLVASQWWLKTAIVVNND